MFDPTLNGVMAQIEAGKIVLPAMQRPFVWKDDRITKLIDSMLRGFPLGTALLWKTATMQRFRRFQKDVAPDAGITVDFDSDDSTERYLVLDGQQRLTSLFVALTGTYDGKKLFVDVLSGVRGDKDPGDAYWDCRFLSEKEAKELNVWPRPAGDKNASSERAVFVKFQDLTKLAAARAGVIATQKAAELGLDAAQTTRMTTSYLQCATVLASKTALQIHLIDEDSGDPMPIEEILEVFVRVNSGGLVLQKSDLLMSLLDLKWNDIQPELYRAVKEINAARPFNITRDDVLKSLLLAKGSETRFDRLVADRVKVEKLASDLPKLLPAVQSAWKSLTLLLMDNCKITSERFFRGGHNSLLPFVSYLVENPTPSDTEKRRLVVAVYLALMSGVFAGAEARMGAFARKECVKGNRSRSRSSRVSSQLTTASPPSSCCSRSTSTSRSTSRTAASRSTTTRRTSSAITSSRAPPWRRPARRRRRPTTTRTSTSCAARTTSTSPIRPRTSGSRSPASSRRTRTTT